MTHYVDDDDGGDDDDDDDGGDGDDDDHEFKVNKNQNNLPTNFQSNSTVLNTASLKTNPKNAD
jgi:hypothetical protein